MQKKTAFIGTGVCAVLFAGALASLPSQAKASGVQENAAYALNQKKVVKGQVTDQNGEALLGVIIKPVSGNGGTVTDIDGNFSFDGAPGTKVTVSYVGFKTVTVTLKEGMTIKMEQDLVGLDDVVVIGYGTVKKKDLTGAVTTMKTEDITIAPTTNAMEALQGKVAGLDITKTSGQVGSGVSILLRGSRSIYGDNAPLFIIDGVQGGSYEDVNPSDIESIDVLKDASSTAIYGSAGANGVIIITTKRGQEGKARVNFDAYYGFSGTPNFQHGMVGDEWMRYQRDAYTYIHGQAPADDASLFGNSDYLNAYQQGKWIDWVDQIKNTATQQKYSLSVSGGTKKTKIFASAAYTNQKGLIETDNQKVYQLRMNIDQELNKWLTASFTSNLNYSDRNLGSRHTFINALKALPLGDPYTEDGEINYKYVGGLTTPLGDFIKNQYAENVRTTYLNVSGSMTWTPIKGLSAKTSFNGILKHARNGKFRGAQASATAPSYSSLPFGESSNTNNWQYNWENVISYNNSIGDHTFGGQLISSYIVGETEYARAYSNGLAMDSYQWHQLKGGDSKAYSEYQKWQKLSYAFRLNYSYKGRYLFNFSNRWDGVSWFVDDNKWDMFPAVALGWRISEENFMGKATDSWLDNLKLRVGYGETGSTSNISPYASTSKIEQSYLTIGGEKITTYGYSKEVANKKLTWERSKSWNIGLDAAFLNSRIDLSMDWYLTNTSNVIWHKNLPVTGGAYNSTTQYLTNVNLAETRNKGIELTLNTRNIVTKDFKWNSTLTFNYNKEEITKLMGTANDKVINGDYVYSVGSAVNSFYHYKLNGIWQTNEADDAACFGMKPGYIKVDVPGIKRHVDENGSVYYTKNDAEGVEHRYDASNPYALSADDYQVIGHNSPDWSLGFQNTFKYKDFDLSIYMYMRWGQMINYKMLTNYDPTGKNNYPEYFNVWSENNPSNDFPAMNASISDKLSYYPGFAALSYVDGSFFKIKNITLGYTLPTNICKRLGLSNLRVYGTITNPLIVSKSHLLKDYDPEMNGNYNYPLTKQLVFGLNIAF